MEKEISREFRIGACYFYSRVRLSGVQEQWRTSNQTDLELEVFAELRGEEMDSHLV
jgi:hypothetical protein